MKDSIYGFSASGDILAFNTKNKQHSMIKTANFRYSVEGIAHSRDYAVNLVTNKITRIESVNQKYLSQDCMIPKIGYKYARYEIHIRIL